MSEVVLVIDTFFFNAAFHHPKTATFGHTEVLPQPQFTRASCVWWDLFSLPPSCISKPVSHLCEMPHPVAPFLGYFSCKTSTSALDGHFFLPCHVEFPSSEVLNVCKHSFTTKALLLFPLESVSLCALAFNPLTCFHKNALPDPFVRLSQVICVIICIHTHNLFPLMQVNMCEQVLPCVCAWGFLYDQPTWWCLKWLWLWNKEAVTHCFS